MDAAGDGHAAVKIRRTQPVGAFSGDGFHRGLVMAENPMLRGVERTMSAT